MASTTYTDPYEAERAAALRRRSIAEAMMAQSMQPMGDTQVINGVAVRRSPMEGIAKVAQAFLGSQAARKADEDVQSASDRQGADISAAIEQYTRRTTPRPAQPGTMTEDPAGIHQLDATPAYTPNMMDRRAAAADLSKKVGDPRATAQMLVADAMKPQAELAKIDPKDYSPESFAAYQQTGDPTKLRAAAPKPASAPSAVQEYEYAKAQGYKGTFEQFQQQQRAAGAPKVTVDQRGQGAYVTKRMGDDAEAVSKLYTAAESAAKSNSALDRIAASNDEAFQGAAAPLLSNAVSFLSTFGYDSKALTNTAAVQQAIGEMLANRMSELGARGLTDKDMEILRDNLPRVNQSKDSRRLVVAVLKKVNEGTIAEAQAQLAHERETYPEMKSARRHAWEGYKPTGVQPTGNPEVDAILRKYLKP